jgi:hypothetical protein
MTSPPRARTKPSVRSSPRARTESPSRSSRTGGQRVRPQRPSLGAVFRADSSNYYMLLGTTLLLVFMGLVMVLSASSVDS